MQSTSSFLLLTIVVLVIGNVWATPNHRQYTATAQRTSIGSLDQCLQRIEPKVCDPHGVFTEEERNRLDEQLARVEESTKREGYPMRNATKKCGMQGITMPIIMLKAEMTNVQDVQRQLNDVNKQYTDEHPCQRIAFIMLNSAEKVDLRRFWSGVNWNVNIKPNEIVALYRKEIPKIQKAKYADALYGISREFINLAMQRLSEPFPEAPMTRTTTGTNQGKGQVTYSAQSDQTEDTSAEGDKQEVIPERKNTNTKYTSSGTKTERKNAEDNKKSGKDDSSSGTVTAQDEGNADDETNKAAKKPKQYRKPQKGGDNKEEENADETSN